MLDLRKRRPLQYALVLLGLILTSTSVQAASFDCQKAGAPIEYLICDAPELDILDTRMGQSYKTARAAAKEVGDTKRRAQIRSDQIAWNKSRLSNCGVPKKGKLTTDIANNAHDCVANLYRQRLAALQAVIASYQEPEAKEQGGANASSAKMRANAPAFDADAVLEVVARGVWSTGECFDDERAFVFRPADNLFMELMKKGSLDRGAMQIQPADVPNAFKLAVAAPGYNVEMVLRIEGSGALKVLERFEEGVVHDPIVGATLKLCDGLQERPKSAAQLRSEAKEAYWNYVTGRWTARKCKNSGPAFIITREGHYSEYMDGLKVGEGRATLSGDSRGSLVVLDIQTDTYSRKLTVKGTVWERTQVVEDERSENAPTNLRLYTVYYRCKTYKPFSAEEIAKREAEKAARQAAYEADYEKAKALVADPKAYLQGKWAAAHEGCNASQKNVFVGDKTYLELNGAPAFGDPPAPYKLYMDGLKMVVETGDFWKKQLASGQFRYTANSEDQMTLGFSELNLASGPMVSTDQRRLIRCDGAGSVVRCN